MRRALRSTWLLFALLGMACDDRAPEAGGPASGADSLATPELVESFVTTPEGRRIRILSAGQGEPVVLVSMAEFLAEPLLPLARGRRVVFFDPLGRGPSDPVDPASITYDRQIEEVEDVRRALGVDRVALIGWSGLAKEMVVYAVRHPDRVSRLVQVSTIPPRVDGVYPQEPGVLPREERIDGAAYEELERRKAAGEFDADSAGYCRALNRVTRPGSLAEPDRTLDLIPDVCGWPNEWPDRLYPYFDAIVGTQPAGDWSDSIAALDIPRLVVHGREDGIPLSGARAWVAGDPQARLLVLSPAGHFPFLEQPESFLRAVDAFLDGGWPEGAESLPEEASAGS